MISKDEMAENLAAAYLEGGSGTEEMFRLVSDDDQENSPGEPVKLLEITPYTVSMGIEPVYFGAHPASGMVYPTMIVAVTPDEFNEDMRRKLEQDYGWRLGQRYPKVRRPHR
jgi:hypothetical protein